MSRGRIKKSTAVNWVIAEYRRLWKKQYCETCVIPIRQRKRIVELLDAIGYSKLVERLQEFFNDNDKWITDRDHPFGYFLNNVNKYRRKHGTIKKDRKVFDAEVENKKEAARKSRAINRSD